MSEQFIIPNQEDATKFQTGDQLDFHKSTVETPYQVIDARRDVSDSYRGGVSSDQLAIEQSYTKTPEQLSLATIKALGESLSLARRAAIAPSQV